MLVSTPDVLGHSDITVRRPHSPVTTGVSHATGVQRIDPAECSSPAVQAFIARADPTVVRGEPQALSRKNTAKLLGEFRAFRHELEHLLGQLPPDVAEPLRAPLARMSSFDDLDRLAPQLLDRLARGETAPSGRPWRRGDGPLRWSSPSSQDLP